MGRVSRSGGCRRKNFINLCKCGSTDKITRFEVDLAVICKEQVYISIVTFQYKAEEGSLTDS